MATTPNYDHIKQLIGEKKAAEARRELARVLFKNSSDPEAWWLYAYVAEDRRQLYYILSALVELPVNPYTGKARAMLSKMPYQHSPKSARLMMRRRFIPMTVWIGAAAVVLVAVLIIGIVMMVAGSKPAPAVAMIPNTNTPTVVVITVTPLPSSTPAPTNTPLPTATRRATSTPFPTATATTEPIVNIAKVLPALNQSLIERSTTLFKATDNVSSIFTAEQLSISTLKDVTDQANQIRKMRNEIMLVNLAQVPNDVRQQVINPAHTAYTEYANSVLQWIDLKVQAYQAFASQPASGKATKSDLNAASEQWKKQTTLANNQAKIVTAKREALQKALNDYSMFTAETVLKAQASAQAIISLSDSSRSMQLPGGTYRVALRLDAANTTSATLWLVSADSKSRTATKMQLTDDTEIELKAGAYRIQAEGANWWAVALDPK